MVQNTLKTNEEARSQAREVVAARITAVQNAFSLVGRMMGTAEDLIVSAGPEYDLSGFEGAERERVLAQIHGLRDNYNKVDHEWRTSEYSYGLLLAYYHPGRKDVSHTWTALTKAVNDYVGCARDWSVAHSTPALYDGSCNARRTRVDASAAQLAEAFGASASW